MTQGKKNDGIVSKDLQTIQLYIPPGRVFTFHAEGLFHSSTPVPNLYPFSFLPEL